MDLRPLSLRAASLLLAAFALAAPAPRPDAPSTGMEQLPYVTTVYSDRPADGNQIFIYRKRAQ